MKNTLVLCALLFIGAYSSGNENVAELKKAVQRQNEMQVKNALAKVGKLSLFNKREIEEAARVILDHLVKEESNSGTISYLIPSIATTIITGIITAAILNTNYNIDDCQCYTAITTAIVALSATIASLAIIISAAKGNTSLKYDKELPLKVENARTILELIQEIPTT